MLTFVRTQKGLVIIYFLHLESPLFVKNFEITKKLQKKGISGGVGG